MVAGLILVAVVALVIYLFANADNEYIFLRDRPKQRESQRKSINYYAWRGPMFVEDFTNFQGGVNNPKAEIVPTCGCCEIPKYNCSVPGARECHRLASHQCRVPTMTSEEGWRHEYWNSQYRMEGPDLKMGTPGNYAQVVNNNLSAPNNLKSVQMRSIMGDWFDPVDKVSPWCYTEMYKKCMMRPR